MIASPGAERASESKGASATSLEVALTSTMMRAGYPGFGALANLISLVEIQKGAIPGARKQAKGEATK